MALHSDVRMRKMKKTRLEAWSDWFGFILQRTQANVNPAFLMGRGPRRAPPGVKI
jgi:hypothetical protein